MTDAATVNRETEVITILNSILGLEGAREPLNSDSQLLGTLPEFDSMTVIAVIETLEDHFGFTAYDDELTESTFLTVGQLVRFVEGKLGQ